MKRESGVYGLIVAVAIASFALGRVSVDNQSATKIKRVFVTVPTVTTTTVYDDCTVILPGGYILHTDKQSAEKSRLHCER